MTLIVFVTIVSVFTKLSIVARKNVHFGVLLYDWTRWFWWSDWFIRSNLRPLWSGYIRSHRRCWSTCRCLWNICHSHCNGIWTFCGNCVRENLNISTRFPTTKVQTRFTYSRFPQSLIYILDVVPDSLSTHDLLFATTDTPHIHTHSGNRLDPEPISLRHRDS